MDRWCVALDERTCAELLEADTVARVAFATDGGPGIETVAYRFSGDRVSFCVAVDSALAQWGPGCRVTLEVDLIDRVLDRGWSVTASGVCRILEAPQQPPRPAWVGDGGPTITLGVLEPVLTGRWVGTVVRSP